MVDVMTDEANIEVPAPVSGRVLRTNGQPGDMVIVGTELIAIETEVNAPNARARANLAKRACLTTVASSRKSRERTNSIDQ